MRSVPAAPTQMVADAVWRQVTQRVVQRVDPHNREFLVRFEAGLWCDHVPAGCGRRIIKLQDQPGLDDRLVLLAHDVGAGIEELLVRPVVAVTDPIGAAGRHSGHKTFLDTRGSQRCF